MELLPRVEAALRRAIFPPTPGDQTVYADSFLTVDFAQHEVYVRGALVHLTPLEYRLLAQLVQRAGEVLTHDWLLNTVWGTEYEAVDSVKWHIGLLRRNLGDDPTDSQSIVTVRQAGYRYERLIQRISQGSGSLPGRSPPVPWPSALG